MRTINPNITIHNSENQARNTFAKVKSADLLKGPETSRGHAYFVDRSKQAIKDWPTKYTLVDTK